MFLEVRGCCAGEFTLCAAEGVFPRMDLNVFFEAKDFSPECVSMCLLRGPVFFAGVQGDQEQLYFIISLGQALKN